MENFIDKSGNRFGRLVVTNKQRKYRCGGKEWLCKCDCGNEKWISSNHLGKNGTKSCGCLSKDIRTKHGLTNTRIYRCWSNMKTRCYNKNVEKYKSYGARGINVCDEWHDATNFISWAKDNGYRDNLTLDRIDVNGNYCPENCQWIPMKEQQKNTQKSVRYKDECASSASRRLGGCENLVGVRIRDYGWSLEHAFTTPVKK